jgi:hypothetical protein
MTGAFLFGLLLGVGCTAVVAWLAHRRALARQRQELADTLEALLSQGKGVRLQRDAQHRPTRLTVEIPVPPPGNEGTLEP